MFGFLLKLVLVIVIIGGVVGFLYQRASHDRGLDIAGVVNLARQVDISGLAGRISSGLDSLITHTDRSPMVMGIEITNKSLEAMVDTIRSLPPEEMEAVRQYICQPATPSSQ